MEKIARLSPPTAVFAPPSGSAAGRLATTLLAEERALLDRVAAQDAQAFALLSARYAAPVRRYLRRRLGPTDLVDEVLQEVLLVLWQQPSACPPTVPLVAWLCGIARHKARNAVPRPAPPPGWPRPALDSAGEDPACVVLRQEAARRLARALDALPLYERTAFTFRVQQGRSYQDIAAVLEVPVSTVRTWVWRAGQRLRAHLAAEEAAPPRLPPVRRSAGRAKRRLSQPLPPGPCGVPTPLLWAGCDLHHMRGHG
jgi:RNA polymerase sigma-70 factor (ECF subfamily)